MQLTDDYVKEQCSEAWRLCGLKSFWENSQAVEGVGKALMYLLSHYSGRWEHYVSITLDNYAWRLRYIQSGNTGKLSI